jgi:hypothetical protein
LLESLVLLEKRQIKAVESIGLVGAVGIEIASFTSKSFNGNGVAAAALFQLEPCGAGCMNR